MKEFMAVLGILVLIVLINLVGFALSIGVGW